MWRAIQVHGHRGARAVLPENTLPAFEYAIAAGADAIEMDVLVTQDDVLVVTHDPELNRSLCLSPAGYRAVRQMTLAELAQCDCGSLRNRRFRRQRPVPGARIPTLEEVLALSCRGAFWFNIEVKSFPQRPELAPAPHRFAALLCDAIRRHNLEDRVLVQSFDFRILRELRDVAPEIHRAALYAGPPRDLSAVAAEAAADIVAPHYALATRGRVARARRTGLQVIPWTANTPRIWKRLIAAQVDGIITDDPAGLIAYLDSAGS